MPDVHQSKNKAFLPIVKCYNLNILYRINLLYIRKLHIQLSCSSVSFSNAYQCSIIDLFTFIDYNQSFANLLNILHIMGGEDDRGALLPVQLPGTRQVLSHGSCLRRDGQ
mgnify:CR=1 FL=1